MIEDRLLTPDDLVARGYADSRKALMQMRSRGTDLPPALKIGNRVRFRLADVLDFEESRIERPDHDDVIEGGLRRLGIVS